MHLSRDKKPLSRDKSLLGKKTDQKWNFLRNFLETPYFPVLICAPWSEEIFLVPLLSGGTTNYDQKSTFFIFSPRP